MGHDLMKAQDGESKNALPNAKKEDDRLKRDSLFHWIEDNLETQQKQRDHEMKIRTESQLIDTTISNKQRSIS